VVVATVLLDCVIGGVVLLLFNTIKRTIPVIAAIINAAIKITNGFLCYQNIFNRYFVVNPTALGAYILKIFLNIKLIIKSLMLFKINKKQIYLNHY
jgi:hypothetical protein